MKIHSVLPTFGNLSHLERSRKGEDSTQKEQSEAGYFQRHSTKEDDEGETPSESELAQALEASAEDPALQLHGLEVQVDGKGPGLRVTLKDGRGAIVRQLTGQEYIELRETAQATGRGKILDRRL